MNEFFCTPLLAAQVYEDLDAGGVFNEGSIARTHLFLSVHDAMLFAQQSSADTAASLKASLSPVPYRKNNHMQSYLWSNGWEEKRDTKKYRKLISI